MHCAEFIALIETYAPPGVAAPWDNSGIQVESGQDSANNICVALDPTPATVSAALELKADFLLCHHPLLLTPRFLNTRDQYFHIVRKLLHADCRLYSAHTSLDANPRGPVAWLAQALRLSNCQILEPMPDPPLPDIVAHPVEKSGFAAPLGYGFGLVGDLPEEIELNAFLAQLEEALRPQGLRQDWRLCGQPGRRVHKIAYCPGSGASLANKAAAAGVDLYITGDVKYHAALETPLPMLDVGHFCLEERMMREFAATLAKDRPNADIRFLSADNPFRQVAI